jgi:CRP-like cAMP-binding protein
MKKIPVTGEDVAEFGKMVKKINFFSAMNMGLLEKILDRINLYQYFKGEKVCRQGDEGDSFYVVRDGRLKVSVREGFVFSKTLAHLVPEDCFGEMALLNRARRNATVTCEEDTRLFVLLADSFDQVLAENPAFAEEIKRLAAERGFELGRNRPG